MKETTKYIKNFNVGDTVTSTNSILLDRGFRGVTGSIRTLVKDDADSWQYLIDLHDGRELQCDDCHLVYPYLDDNQQVVLDWLKEETQKWDDCPFKVIKRFFTEVLHKRLPKNVYVSYLQLNDEQKYQVLAAFAEWGMEQEGD